jgi:hypothetical protein
MMTLIKTEFGYNFWKGFDEEGEPYYNVIPQDQPKPQGGYKRAEYICRIKHVPNCFINLTRRTNDE